MKQALRKLISRRVDSKSLDEPEKPMVFRQLFGKIKQGLAKTRQVFSGGTDLFRGRGRVDRNSLDELEKRLYLADVGTAATNEIVERVRQSFLDKEISGDVETFVKAQLRELLSSA